MLYLIPGPIIPKTAAFFSPPYHSNAALIIMQAHFASRIPTSNSIHLYFSSESFPIHSLAYRPSTDNKLTCRYDMLTL